MNVYKICGLCVIVETIVEGMPAIKFYSTCVMSTFLLSICHLSGTFLSGRKEWKKHFCILPTFWT